MFFRRLLVGFVWGSRPFLGLWLPILLEYRGGFLGFGGLLVFPMAFPPLTVVPGRSSKDKGWESFPLFSSGHISLRRSWILWLRRGFLLRSGVRTRRLPFRCIRYGR